MIYSEQLKNLFPRETEIPEEHRPLGLIHQRSYLVDGVLKNWDGPVQTVLSPVCVRRDNGELEQVELGSYPLGEEAQSEEALGPPSPPTTMAEANGRP
jgi:glyceraldehyde-3-phosphate dehydrogenase (NADP+)